VAGSCHFDIRHSIFCGSAVRSWFSRLLAWLIVMAALLALSASGCWWSSKGGAREGSEAVSSKALEQLRSVARDTAWDESLPVEKRVEAFEALRRSFPNGTSEEVVVRYFDPESRTRLDEGRDAFVLRVVGPDGRDRWLTIVNGKLSNDPKKEKE